MSKKVVVIEDEEQLGKLIQSYLEQYDYQVIHVRDGINGLKVVHEQVPDLVLMDLLLPRMHGFDICQSVRKEPRLQHIPLIIMTSVYKSVMDKIKIRGLDVDEFIEKPLDFGNLLNKIDRLTGMERKLDSEGALLPRSLPELDFDPDIELTKSGVNSVPGAIEQQMEKIQLDYAAQLPDKISEMEDLWSIIQKSKDNYKRLAIFRRLTHKLIGSGATFGFEEITRDAQQLELLLDMIIMEGEETLANRKEKIDGLLDNMRLHPMVTTEKQLRKMKL